MATLENASWSRMMAVGNVYAQRTRLATDIVATVCISNKRRINAEKIIVFNSAFVFLKNNPVQMCWYSRTFIQSSTTPLFKVLISSKHLG